MANQSSVWPGVPMQTYAFVTQPLPERPWPLLTWSGTAWVSRSPMSTYELVCKVVAWRTRLPAKATTYEECKPYHGMCTAVHCAVEKNPVVFGTYAGLDTFTLVMSDDNLRRFCELVDAEWNRAGGERIVRDPVAVG